MGKNPNHPQKIKVAQGLGRPWFRLLLVAVAAVYFLIIWLNAIGSRSVHTAVPAVPRYFAQIACLFPRAAQASIEYRAEGWSCEQQQFIELDVRPHFPIHQDNKESRFHRAAHFLRRHRPSMQGLESYLIARHNAQAPPDGGLPMGRIGGIRVSSVRIPLLPRGAPVPRWRYEQLSAYPQEFHKQWYWTPQSKRAQFCESHP